MSEKPARERPARHGHRWMLSDHQQLVELVRQGADLPAMCLATGRSAGGVVGQLRRLLPDLDPETPPAGCVEAARDAFADPEYPWQHHLAQARRKPPSQMEGQPPSWGFHVALPDTLGSVDWISQERGIPPDAWIAEAVRYALEPVQLEFLYPDDSAAITYSENGDLFLQVRVVNRPGQPLLSVLMQSPRPLDWWERAVRDARDIAAAAFRAVRVDGPDYAEEPASGKGLGR